MKSLNFKIFKIRRRLLIILIAALILVPGVVSAILPAYMELVGENQGRIEGSCDIEGREGSIIVYAMEHEISVPTDSSGLPTGKRIHHPLTITKEIDKSSPKLHQALVTGERLDHVVIKFYRIDPTGVQEHYYTIRLEDGKIISIEPWDSQGKKFENVSFIYQRIIWTWEPEGIEAEDSWLPGFEVTSTPPLEVSKPREHVPFSIDIKPREVTVKPGESITYKMRIEAETGFEDPINLTLEIKSPVYSKNFDLGTVYPPYPKDFEYTVEIPSNVPIGILGEGKLKAVSGSYVKEEVVKLRIKGAVSGFEIVVTVIALLVSVKVRRK